MLMRVPSLRSPHYATANGSNRPVSAAFESAPVIHRTAWRYQPEPARACDISADNAPIFREQRPPPATCNPALKLGRWRNSRRAEAVAAVNVLAELHHAVRARPSRHVDPVQRHRLGQMGGFLLAGFYDPVDVG